MQKVASSLAIPLILLLLDATGYAPNSAEQSSAALMGIRLVVGPIPAVLLWGGILFAWLYPLSRAEHAQIVANLEVRRAASSPELPQQAPELS
jgi:GPH family glycoside/pentoside/hexuronide:cation symporter